MTESHQHGELRQGEAALHRAQRGLLGYQPPRAHRRQAAGL